MIQVPITATTTTYNLLQDLSYGYDTVGNIISINEKAPTGLGRSVSYTYDGLYRLLTATAVASSSPYSATYTYNALGNMLSNTGVGYTYAGTGYANPHAPTTIGTSTLSYDNSGNVLSHASSTYTWDYNNRMTTAGGSGGSSSFDYDLSGQRTLLSIGGVSTKYPTANYNTDGTAVTKHIMLGDSPIVSIVKNGSGGGSTSTTTTHSVYADALASGWNDWSWDSTRNFSNTTPVYAGTNSISVAYTAAWGGLYLNHAGISTAGSTHIQFAIRSAVANPVLDLEMYGVGEVFLGTIPLTSVLPTMAANTWYLVSVPLSSVGSSNTTLTGIMFVKNSSGTVYFDDIKLISVTTGGGGGGSTPVTQYLYQDHLGGTALTADSVGKMLESTDYMPFGGVRINTSVNGTKEQRTYIGQEYDPATSLSYLNARYYNGTRGQFMSQDPEFWMPTLSTQLLTDPQQQNSYSYSRNNPINGKDPSGRVLQLILLPIIGYAGGYGTSMLDDIAVGIQRGESNEQIRATIAMHATDGTYVSSGSRGAVITTALAITPVTSFAGVALATFNANLYYDLTESFVSGATNVDVKSFASTVIDAALAPIVKYAPGLNKPLAKATEAKVYKEVLKTAGQSIATVGIQTKISSAVASVQSTLSSFVDTVGSFISNIFR
jgi:RHS repeat-associated protein